eukprot:1769419-Pleurochrysis_carterae.AAC.2
MLSTRLASRVVARGSRLFSSSAASASAIPHRALIGGAVAVGAAGLYYGNKTGCLSLDITFKLPVEIDTAQLVRQLRRCEYATARLYLFKLLSLLPADLSSLTKVAKDDLGLLPQPEAPTYRTALVEIYVRSAPYGGSDKSSNGHRYDSIPFANGMINAGMSCNLVHYVHEEHDKFVEAMKQFDAIIVRCNPGQIKADGGSQAKFDDAMRGLQKLGIQV